MSDHIAGLQYGHAKGDSETRQNGRSVRRRGTCSGYAYVSPGCGTGKMGVFSGNGMEFLFLRKKNYGKWIRCDMCIFRIGAASLCIGQCRKQ